MNFLFETPIPIILIFLALLTLTAPAFSKYKWAKICKYFIIVLLGYYFLSINSMVIRKSEVGNRKHEAHLVSIFTSNINSLISSGQHDRARKLLAKFADEYPAVSGHNKMAEDFLNGLIAESAANKPPS